MLVVQFLDVAPLVHTNISKPVSGFNHEPWTSLFLSHKVLQVAPRSGCTQSPFSHYVNSELGLAAEKYDLQTNSFPSARHAYPCPETGSNKYFEIDQDTLYILHNPPNNELDVGSQFNSKHCRSFMSMYVCSQKIALVSGYSEFSPMAFEWRLDKSVRYSVTDHEKFERLLLSNWHSPESWGVWTKPGEVRMLLPKFDAQEATTLLSIDVAAYFGFTTDDIEVPVSVNGEHRTTWTFSPDDNRNSRVLLIKSSDYKNSLPVITFTIPQTVSPFTAGISSDLRELRFSLYSFGADLIDEKTGSSDIP